MKNLIREFWNYVNPKNTNDYSLFHGPINDQKNKNVSLNKFLSATMDEVRLRYANLYADEVLSLSNSKHLSYFRRAVLKREIASDTDYYKQRDHAAHTLYNYLFGWYIFSNNDLIRPEIAKKLEQRIIIDNPSDVTFGFGNMWSKVSLLHDIGYIFEGSLGTLSSEVQNAKIKLGLEIVKDYFEHKFWLDNRIDSIEDRKTILKKSKIEIPSFQTDSIASVADTLCMLGPLDVVRKRLKKDLKHKKCTIPDIVKKKDGLKSDAFDLWQDHYKAYGQPEMAEKISDLRTVFQTIIWDGLPGSDLRIIDHGIASGLLILKASAFFYQLYHGMVESKPNNEEEIRIRHFFTNKMLPKNVSADPTYWWIGNVWATAASAIHNVQQFDVSWPGCSNKQRQLSIKEDPIAYVGVLVDILQEWDRYTVNRTSIISGLLPIQGIDIKLGCKTNKIHIRYPDKNRTKRIIQTLDDSLKKWHDIIEIK